MVAFPVEPSGSTLRVWTNPRGIPGSTGASSRRARDSPSFRLCCTREEKVDRRLSRLWCSAEEKSERASRSASGWSTPPLSGLVHQLLAGRGGGGWGGGEAPAGRAKG